MDAEFGGSITNTTRQTTKVSYTLGSDDLGEAVLEWTDPIVTRDLRNFLWMKDRVATYTISTGTVVISCETVRK